MAETPPSAASTEAGLAGYARAGYSKQSGLYTKSNARRLVTGSILCIVFLLGGIKLLRFGGGDPIVLGVIISVASLAGLIYVGFVAIKTIELDGNKNAVVISRGLIFGKMTVYPFDKMRSLEIASFYGNWFMRKQRSFSLRVEGLKKPVPLSGATRSSAKLTTEHAFLSVLMGKDPIRDLNYVETRVG